MTIPRIVLSAVTLVGLVAGPALAVTIETVPVGNPGNAGEWSGQGYGPWERICGRVDYTYNIGKYEVTAGQYTAFLNAVAATDPYKLYDTSMWANWNGCKIQRDGASGSYTYSVASDYASRPVNFVSWGDAARFANWLHNGQPTGAQDARTTEDGVYTLNGAMTNAELLSVNRNSNWRWAISSEDEWYKAAYHKNDGVTGNYWLYPTTSDSINTTMANYGNSVRRTTDVGSYPYPSPYGTLDQGGNVEEWNEAVMGWYRGLRGGSCEYGSSYLLASNLHGSDPAYGYGLVGFRVVQVPEPATMVMLALAGVGVLVRRRGAGKLAGRFSRPVGGASPGSSEGWLRGRAAGRRTGGFRR